MWYLADILPKLTKIELRLIRTEISRLTMIGEEELAAAAKELQAPLHLVRQVAAGGRLPVVVFCAGDRFRPPLDLPSRSL